MILVVSGKARTGKDTAGIYLKTILHKHHHVEFETIAYADDLKRRVKEDFGLTDEQVYGGLKEEHIKSLPGWTPRKLLQFVGTEVFRNIDPDFWVKQVQKKICQNPPEANYIITDARFANEIDWVLEAGGLHFRTTRQGADFTSGMTHASEISLDNLDMSKEGNHVLTNDGTLADFYSKIGNEVLDIVLGKITPITKHQLNGG